MKYSTTSLLSFLLYGVKIANFLTFNFFNAFIAADYDIGKVDQNFLLETLSQIEIKNADALFISCTALPVLNIIDRLEKKLNKPVLSSNQTLIWDTLEKIGKNNNIKGFGSLFTNS